MKCNNTNIATNAYKSALNFYEKVGVKIIKKVDT